MLLHY